MCYKIYYKYIDGEYSLSTGYYIIYDNILLSMSELEEIFKKNYHHIKKILLQNKYKISIEQYYIINNIQPLHKGFIYFDNMIKAKLFIRQFESLLMIEKLSI